MREYSETAWNVANQYSDVLASETRDLAAHIDKAMEAKDAELERLRAEILGWKLTALAMRDEAIHWEGDGAPRCSEIERMYFDAAMGVGFVPPKARPDRLRRAR